MTRVRLVLAKDLRVLRRSPLLLGLLVVYPLLVAGLVGLVAGDASPKAFDTLTGLVGVTDDDQSGAIARDVIEHKGLKLPKPGKPKAAPVEAAKKEPSPEGPKSIGKVFAARHLSYSGPVSYGNAAFGFEDIMFVDIGLYLHNGERAMNRTLVIKDRDGNVAV